MTLNKQLIPEIAPLPSWSWRGSWNYRPYPSSQKGSKIQGRRPSGRHRHWRIRKIHSTYSDGGQLRSAKCGSRGLDVGSGRRQNIKTKSSPQLTHTSLSWLSPWSLGDGIGDLDDGSRFFLVLCWTYTWISFRLWNMNHFICRETIAVINNA